MIHSSCIKFDPEGELFATTKPTRFEYHLLNIVNGKSHPAEGSVTIGIRPGRTGFRIALDRRGLSDFLLVGKNNRKV